MIVLRRFRDLPEAELASAALESAGIENLLADAQTIGIDWAWSQALGGIRLEVPDVDAPDADALLSLAFPPGDDAVDPSGGIEACPACGAADVMLEYGARRTLVFLYLLATSGPIALLLLLVLYYRPPAFLWRTHECCRSCGVCRAVPFQFRPEIFFAYSAAAVGAFAIPASAVLLIGFVQQLLAKIR